MGKHTNLRPRKEGHHLCVPSPAQLETTCDALNDTMDATVGMADKRFATQAAGWGGSAPKNTRSECLMAPSGQGAHLSFDRKGSRIRTLVNAWLPTPADMIICLQQTSR